MKKLNSYKNISVNFPKNQAKIGNLLNSVEFVEEFMAEVVIFYKNGNSTTRAQVILPQYNEDY